MQLGGALGLEMVPPDFYLLVWDLICFFFPFPFLPRLGSYHFVIAKLGACILVMLWLYFFFLYRLGASILPGTLIYNKMILLRPSSLNVVPSLDLHQIGYHPTRSVRTSRTPQTKELSHTKSFLRQTETGTITTLSPM
jgi:hypothetical protein